MASDEKWTKKTILGFRIIWLTVVIILLLLFLVIPYKEMPMLGHDIVLGSHMTAICYALWMLITAPRRVIPKKPL